MARRVSATLGPAAAGLVGAGLVGAGLVAAGLLGGGCGTPSPSSSSPSPPPSILFVLYDDLDLIGDLGPYGADPEQVETPFSDLLAREGKRFERFYVNAPVCSPTRVGLLTGRHPARFGFTWASDEPSRRGIPESVPSLPRLLAGLGYRTGAFGKWHIGHATDEIAPRGVGFERSAIDCSFTNLGRSGPGLGNGYADAAFCDGPGWPLEDSGGVFATTYTVDRAIDFIRETLEESPARPLDAPFYAQIWLHAPHTPLTCPPGQTCPDCEDRPCGRGEKRRIHHAMIEHAERELMRLRRELEARGAWKNMLVILASDNGGAGAWHEPSERLRGEKGSLHERGLRTPLLVAGPGIEAGVVGEAVAGFDLLPTLAERLGFADQLGADGVSFADLLWADSPPSSPPRAEQRRRRALFWDVRPDSRFDEHSPTGGWRRFAVRKQVGEGTYKLVLDDLWGGGAEPRLFELGADERESRDISWKREIRNHLQDELRHWRSSTFRLRPGAASLVGDASRQGDAFSFDGGHALLEQHPALQVGRFDLSIALSITPSAVPRERAWIAGREGSWSIGLENGRLVFEIEGHRPQRLEQAAVLEPGKRHRVVATIENRLGLTLWFDDRAARARVRFGRVPQTDAPIRLGSAPDGGEPFKGRIEELAFYSSSLRADDLELDGLGRFDFEADQSFGTVEGGRIAPQAAYRGKGGLALEAAQTAVLGNWPLPAPLPGRPEGTRDSSPGIYSRASPHASPRVPRLSPRATEVQLSAWLRADTEDADQLAPARLELICTGHGGRVAEHARGGISSRHLAHSEWRRVVVRHLCPAGAETVRVTLAGSGLRTFWDDVSLGVLAQASLELDFEQEPAVEGDGWRRRRPGRGGGFAWAAPAGAATPSFDVELGEARSLEVSVWARQASAVQASAVQASDLGKAQPRAASIRLETTCLDREGTVLAVEVGNLPDRLGVRTSPGRLDGQWRLFKLWPACPVEAATLGVRLVTLGGGEVEIDDLFVVAR